MADLGIYCKNANIIARAGSGASATSAASTWTDTVVLDAEAVINVMTRKVWAVDAAAYAALSAAVKQILMDAAACYCAIYVIMYDMSGYSSRAEAQTMIDVNYNNFIRNIKVLEDLKMQDFITGA